LDLLSILSLDATTPNHFIVPDYQRRRSGVPLHVVAVGLQRQFTYRHIGERVARRLHFSSVPTTSLTPIWQGGSMAEKSTGVATREGQRLSRRDAPSTP